MLPVVSKAGLERRTSKNCVSLSAKFGGRSEVWTERRSIRLSERCNHEFHVENFSFGSGAFWPVRRAVRPRDADGAAARVGACLRTRKDRSCVQRRTGLPVEILCWPPDAVATCSRPLGKTWRSAN